MNHFKKLLGLIIVFLLTTLWISPSHIRFNSQTTHGLLRVSLHSSQNKQQLCHQLSESELSSLAPHMRQTKQCITLYFPYQLSIMLNGQHVANIPFVNDKITHGSEMIAIKEIPLTPGNYLIETQLLANNPQVFLNNSSLSTSQKTLFDTNSLKSHYTKQQVYINANEIYSLQLH